MNVPSLSPEVLQVLRPYLVLGEKLGSLAAQLAPRRRQEIVDPGHGRGGGARGEALGTAVLRGLLDRLIDLDSTTA